MDHHTVYIDLDHARTAATREGIELNAGADIVVLNGTDSAFDALHRAAVLASARRDVEESR